MGQKVNPHGLRVGIIKDWDSRWYAEKDFADNLVEDDKIRKYIKNHFMCSCLLHSNRTWLDVRYMSGVHCDQCRIRLLYGGSSG